MAVLETIRKRGRILLLIFVGMAMLFFIINPDMFAGGSSVETDIANINGESVPYLQYNRRLERTVEFYEQQRGRIDDRMREQLQIQVWEQLVKDYIMTDELSKIGIAIHPDEVTDMVYGNNIDPLVRQMFTDPNTGTFNPNTVLGFLQNLDANPQGKRMWIYIEQQLIESRTMTKYNNLVSKGLYATTAETKRNYDAKNRRVDVTYIQQPYSAVNDSEVSVSEDEIKKYYALNKEHYKQEKSRDIVYVSFPVMPSATDEKKSFDDISSLKNEFEKTTEAAQFMLRYSDNKNAIENKYFAKGELTPDIDSLMFALEIGAVYGPYLNATRNGYRLAKKIDQTMMPDTVSARHILISTKDRNITSSRAKQIADSLKKLIDKGADFSQLVQQHSDDKGSLDKGGEYKWFTQGAMVAPFNDFCFHNKVGTIGIVETQFGSHIIEVTARGKEVKKVKVVIIEDLFEPSAKTRQGVYSKASEFASKYTTAAQIEQAIIDQNLSKRLASVRELDNVVAGLRQGMDSPRSVVRSAFKTEKDQLLTNSDGNPVFDMENNYIVAYLQNVRDDEYAPLNVVRAEIEKDIIKDKKAEILIQKMNDAMAGAQTIDQVASKLTLEAKTVSNLSFTAATIAGIGSEKALIAQASKSDVNQLSKPVKGTNGVYVFMVTDVKPYNDLTDIAKEKKTTHKLYEDRIRNSSLGFGPVYEAVKNKANIDDNRAKFF